MKREREEVERSGWTLMNCMGRRWEERTKEEMGSDEIYASNWDLAFFLQQSADIETLFHCFLFFFPRWCLGNVKVEEIFEE